MLLYYIAIETDSTDALYYNAIETDNTDAPLLLTV
jgi:hypothetical protein